MIGLLLALAAGAPASSEAQRLGEQLASQGSFGSIIGAMGAQQTEELIKEIQNPTTKEQQQMRRIAMARLAAVRMQADAKVGAIYARHYTIEELRAIMRFYGSPAGQALRRETIATLPEIATALQGIDFKADVRAAFCKDTGKLCTK